MSLSLWRFFLEELLTLERKGQPADIQVVVPVPVLGLCDTLRKGSRKSRQQALLGSERQSSCTDASQSWCPSPAAALSPHVVFFIASEENNESPEDNKYDEKNK